MKTSTLTFLAACAAIWAGTGPAALADDPAGSLRITETTLLPMDVGTNAAVTLRIRNDSTQGFKDPSVQCDFIDDAGTTLLSRKQVLHGDFPAQQTTTHTHIDFGTIDQKTKTVKCQFVAG